MRFLLTIAAVGSALMMGAAAGGQTHGGTPGFVAADGRVHTAESPVIATDPANPDPQPDDIAEDIETVTVREHRPAGVVCTWRRRSGSNIRERRCRSAFQAEREEEQAAYALRRLRGF